MAYTKKKRIMAIEHISGQPRHIDPNLVGGIQLNAFSENECTLQYGKGAKLIKVNATPSAIKNQLNIFKQAVK